MLTIIGCGNLNRSDDGVGVVVARRLMGSGAVSAREGVRIFDAGTGGMEVMFHARGADTLVLIDASRHGAEPGSILRVPGEHLMRDHVPAFSLHDFRWDHALYAGRQMFGADFPRDVTVFLIEAGTLELGLALSEPVRRAADRVTADIESIIEAYSIDAHSVHVAAVATGEG